ncbi:MAG: hypothetical protein M9928_02140 [Anaerolineae bacterium]|nr:hypothetical protein [Anaerolineae bacterium]MCO5188263.1 hypothetical protein [Anaerolineae bacterium]MCO5192325.1 hypothetical protein [Anaerolineae bacterium]MCO5197571.1 hypothetical protein [Anaerolineae bacterium]MCO5203804.1 hypothetical protein [Anaerolineae bacterium]
MNSYQQLSTKALGVAFIAAPLLLITGMATYMLGIGGDSFGVSGWMEGVFLSYAFLLFVPVFLGLARLLGTNAPRLGLLTAVTGLGIGFGILPSIARIIQAGLANAGYDIAIFSLDAPGMPILLLYLALGLLTPIVLGIGFLRYGGIPSWNAVLLIIAPIVFVMGQGGDESIATWQVRVMYPLATVIWFLAFAPIGMRLLGNTIVTDQVHMQTAR